MRSTISLLRFLAVPVLMALVMGGDCNSGAPDDEGDPGPGCTAPAYQDEDTAVNVLVDHYFRHDSYPEDPGEGDLLVIAIIDGELPPGVQFWSDGGQIDGEPAETGTWVVTVKASRVCDGAEEMDTQVITINVVDECPLITGPPSWGFVADVGETVNQSLPHGGGLGDLRFIHISSVPPGLDFDEDTGTYTGAITEPGAWSAAVIVEDECVPEAQTVSVEVTITATSTSDEIPAGDYGCPITDPISIHVEEHVAFGNIEPPYCVVAGSNSWAKLSLQPPYFAVLGAVFNPTLSLWGAVPVASGGTCAAPAGRLMASYGPTGGFLTGWNEETGQFNASQAISGTIFDACKQDCDDVAGDSWAAMCLSSPASVRGVHHNQASGFPEFLPGSIQPFSLEGGTPRSACPLSSGGREVFVVTDADSPEGSKLYHCDFDTPAENGTAVAALGSHPTRVRENGGWWCVPDFEDDTITCGLTNDGHGAEVTATVPVGEAPFGCDVEPLGDGTALLSCTGSEDSSYTVVHLDAAGQVLSSDTFPLPTGQTGPEDCAFAEDGSKLIITCKGSDSIVVVDTGR